MQAGSLGKFRDKIASYREYRSTGVFQDTYGSATFSVLVVAPSAPRCRILGTLAKTEAVPFHFRTEGSLGPEIFAARGGDQ